jgi:hypothetical protein
LRPVIVGNEAELLDLKDQIVHDLTSEFPLPLDYQTEYDEKRIPVEEHLEKTAGFDETPRQR